MKLEVRSVSFGYTEKKVIENLELELTPGIYGLLGPNGAGKSTLIHLLVNNRVPDSGEILWNGTEIGSLGADYRKVIGYKPQQQAVYPEFRVAEFLYYMAELKGIPRTEQAGQIDALLRYLNLEDHRRKRLRALSGGMLQRALFAQALLGNPSFLILDEPTAGLDPLERINMRKLIRESSENRIVLLATHIIEDVGPIAKEFLFMDRGKLLLKGDMPTLRKYFETGRDEGRMNSVEVSDEVMILENLFYELFHA